MTPDAGRLLLKVQLGGWNRETFRFFILDPRDGEQRGSWDSPLTPSCLALDSAAGRIAAAYRGGERGEGLGRILELRDESGGLLENVAWDSLPLSVEFSDDGSRLFVADDAGNLTCLDRRCQRLWQTDVGCTLVLAAGRKGVQSGRLYAGGRDGRLRAFNADGRILWTVDLTPAMNDRRPMDLVAQAGRLDPAPIVEAVRPSNCSPTAPPGPNLLAGCKAARMKIADAQGKPSDQDVAANGKATLSLGGTPGWMSAGRVQVKPEELANGKTDDVDVPWLHPHEMFWDGTAGRQVYVIIDFAAPTDVRAITVYENPERKSSWPTQGLIQLWDEKLKQWDTVKVGTFLHGPVNTYEVNLRGVRRIRYVPWSNYFRNFYTSEIEIR